MAEIWIHRKCARPKSDEYAGDELITPKHVDNTGIELCEVCRTHVPTRGPTYLHKGEEVNWSAPVEAVEAEEGTSEEVAESNVQVEETTEEVEAETVEESTESEGEAEVPDSGDSDDSPEDITEPAVEAESEPSKPLAKKQAEIAALQAQIEALEE